MSVLTLILNWLSGGVISALVSAYQAKQQLEQNADVQAKELALADIQARQAIALAEVKSKLLSIPRFVVEMSVALYIGKVLLWDKVLGSLTDGSTDAINGAVGLWCGIVVGGMFGNSIADRVTRKLTNN